MNNLLGILLSRSSNSSGHQGEVAPEKLVIYLTIPPLWHQRPGLFKLKWRASRGIKGPEFLLLLFEDVFTG